MLLFKMNSEARNILGFNSLVKSIQQLPPEFINLPSVLLGLWSFVILKLFAAVHTWLSTYSTGCHSRYSWKNVSTSQTRGFCLLPEGATLGYFFAKRLKYLYHYFSSKPKYRGDRFYYYLSIQIFVYLYHPPMHVTCLTNFVFGSLIFPIYMKNSNY